MGNSDSQESHKTFIFQNNTTFKKRHYPGLIILVCSPYPVHQNSWYVMTSPRQIKKWVSERLPPQLYQWLWARKVAFGNRRVRELGRYLSKRIHEAAQQDLSLFERISTKAEWEFFRHERLDPLRCSLTNNVTHSETPDSAVTGTLEKDRY